MATRYTVNKIEFNDGKMRRTKSSVQDLITKVKLRDLITKAKLSNEVVESRCKKFANGTSMHGFSELYHAQSNIFKSFWILVIAAALGFSLYQVYQATDQFIHQTSSTSIEPLNPDHVLYPPMKLCVNHWIQWIDWDKASELKYTRRAILYGLSSMYHVISNISINIDRARIEFEKAQQTNNISTYHDFFLLVARSVNDFVYTVEIKVDGEEMQIVDPLLLFNDVSIQSDSGQLCYHATSERIKYVLDDNNSKGNMFQIKVYDDAPMSLPQQTLTPLVYASYVLYWMKEKYEHYQLKHMENWAIDFETLLTDADKYSTLVIPLTFFANSYDPTSIDLFKHVDTFRVTVKAFVNRWMSKDGKRCTQDQAFIFPNTTCFDKCAMGKWKQVFNKTDEDLRVTTDRWCCIGNVYFVSDNGTVGKRLMQANDEEGSPSWNECQGKRHNETNNEIYYKERLVCEQQCAHLAGCEKWKFDVAVSTSSQYPATGEGLAVKSKSIIFIQYPSNGETLIVIETDRQSWDNFVGSIGGIVGVWTGASILSLIQLIYLCFCDRTSEEEYPS